VAARSDAELVTSLGRAGFTPAQRDVGGLVGLVVAGDEPAATRAAPALAGLAATARDAILARELVGGLDDGARARLIAVLGRIAKDGDADARTALLARVGEAALPVRVRRAAIVAAGKLAAEADDARAALVARWDDAGDAIAADERRALAEALGKLGGHAALVRLHALDAGADAELARRRDRAVLIAERDARRDAASAVAVDIPPPAPVTVRLHCKPGLGGLLADELRERGLVPHATGDDHAEVTLAGPWQTLFASRLWATAGVRLPLAGDAPEVIAAAIVATQPLLAAWTLGPIRWRLGFRTGHRRAVVWRVARAVATAAPALLNDPTATTWDIVVDEPPALELVPRRAADPRFAWRVADVPASSHPTVAAALARVGGARDGDRVWDPFCGAGAELVERARLGPFAALYGGDSDADALAAARRNLDAAGLPATLAVADARDPAGPPGSASPGLPTYPATEEASRGTIELVITNPPLGGRIRGDAAKLLVEALPAIVGRLANHGRLAWITPAPRRTGPALERLGLRRTFAARVDLGGVVGALERWER
jgi:predicted RNA methylase